MKSNFPLTALGISPSSVNMKKLGIGLFRKKTIQASTKTGLAASVAVPDSGITFVNNSQGASSALIEFTNAISAAVDHMDLDGIYRKYVLAKRNVS
jgi:hypothetical protein